jgi:hypothetical protein
MKYAMGFAVNAVASGSLGFLVGRRLDILMNSMKIAAITGMIIFVVCTSIVWLISILIQGNDAEPNALVGLFIGSKAWPIALILGWIFGYYNSQFGVRMFGHAVNPALSALVASIIGVLLLGILSLLVGMSAGLIHHSTNNEIIAITLIAIAGGSLLINIDTSGGIPARQGSFLLYFIELYYSCAMLLGIVKSFQNSK